MSSINIIPFLEIVIKVDLVFSVFRIDTNRDSEYSLDIGGSYTLLIIRLYSNVLSNALSVISINFSFPLEPKDTSTDTFSNADNSLISVFSNGFFSSNIVPDS